MKKTTIDNHTKKKETKTSCKIYFYSERLMSNYIKADAFTSN